MAKKLYEIAFEIGGKLQASLPKSIFSAAGQLDKLGQKISTLERAQGTSTRFRSLHNEIDQTKLKLRQAEGELRHLGSAVGPMTAAMAHSFDAASSRVGKLRDQLHGQLVEMKSVKATMGASGIRQGSFAADSAKLAASLSRSRVRQQLTRENLGARVANKEKREEARKKFDDSKGKLLGAAAGVAAWVLPLKITADFEDSIVRAGALAKATDGQLTELTNTARVLGRETRFSATQAATGMQFLAQSGFKTNEIIAAMPGMLNIAAAGQVDLGEAADITSNILRGFGMQAGESSRLGDVLTNTFTNSSTTLSTLGETMKYVAPISHSLGISLETTAAAAGLLGTAGIKGEQAGTSMRAMFLRLAAPLTKGQKALDYLKVKTMDAHKNLRPLVDILTDLSRKMQGLGSGTKQAMTKAIFGMEAATAATVLIGEAGSGNLQRFTKAVAKSGTAQEIAAKQNATLKGQWDNLYGSIEDVGIQIGYTLIPTLNRLVNAMVPVINNVTTWLQKNPELTQTLVLGGAALSALVIGLTVAGVAFNGAKLAVLAAQGALLLLNVATWDAAAAWTAANLPMLLGIAAVAGLAYIAYQLYEAWNPISQWWNELWDGMLDKVASVWNAIPKPIRWMISKASGGIYGIDDMARGNVTSTFGAKAPLSAFIAQAQAATDAKLDAFLNPKAEEPSWLKKKPVEEPSWLHKANELPGRLDAAGKLKGGSGGKRGGDIKVEQNFTIPPGTPESVKGAMGEAGAFAKKELERLLRGISRDEERTSLD